MSGWIKTSVDLGVPYLYLYVPVRDLLRVRDLNGLRQAMERLSIQAPPNPEDVKCVEEIIEFFRPEYKGLTLWGWRQASESNGLHLSLNIHHPAIPRKRGEDTRDSDREYLLPCANCGQRIREGAKLFERSSDNRMVCSQACTGPAPGRDDSVSESYRAAFPNTTTIGKVIVPSIAGTCALCSKCGASATSFVGALYYCAAHDPQVEVKVEYVKHCKRPIGEITVAPLSDAQQVAWDKIVQPVDAPDCSQANCGALEILPPPKCCKCDHAAHTIYGAHWYCISHHPVEALKTLPLPLNQAAIEIRLDGTSYGKALEVTAENVKQMKKMVERHMSGTIKPLPATAREAARSAIAQGLITHAERDTFEAGWNRAAREEEAVLKAYCDAGEPITTRVIEVNPSEAWNIVPTVFEPAEEAGQSPFEKAWDDLTESLVTSPAYSERLTQVVKELQELEAQPSRTLETACKINSLYLELEQLKKDSKPAKEPEKQTGDSEGYGW